MSSVTTLGRRSLPTVSDRMTAVRVVFSPDARAVGRALPLDGGGYVIGREAKDEGLIADPRLSREHLEIALSPTLGAYAIEDLKSRNGTFVDGSPLTERTPIVPGQVIAAGDTLFVVDEEPEASRFPRALDADATEASEIKGISYVADEWRRAVATIARAKGSALLLGPTGTGKEVSARAIHRLSGRRGRFVAINCAAIPTELAEAELFGARKGAFTGALEDRAGVFVESSGGTLFLDEVGDLAPPLQAKLLRVLEEGAVQPLGGGKPVPVDLRIVAATQLDLDAVSFRKDLFARLGDWVLRIPALAERRADVLTIFDAFLADEGKIKPYSAELAEALLLHDWPMNARELRQIARRLTTLADSAKSWDLDLLPAELQRPVRARAAPEGAAPDRATLEAALKAAGGNVSKAAEKLGKDRKSVYRWLRRLGIDPATFR